MPSRHKYKQTNWQRIKKHLVWMAVLQWCCAVLLLMWDPSPACFLICTSLSHSVNWEQQLITCYAASDSTDKWPCAVLSFTAADRSFIWLFCFLHFVKPQRQPRTSARALTLVYSHYFCPLWLNPHHLCIGVPFFLVRPLLDCLVFSQGNLSLTTILKYWSYYEARTKRKYCLCPSNRWNSSM